MYERVVLLKKQNKDLKVLVAVGGRFKDKNKTEIPFLFHERFSALLKIKLGLKFGPK